ncbi:transitional endoplasmic reticulum ATPase [Parafrankia irregularis]|uniref:Transitional endoplasmic reticulum ATPase n=1 Tax=Parafrankia irregularis TaxID=795642 RepID=A0A0S4QVV9_9ACTN|nr:MULTISPECIES: AAA family ATPase [Parafrankia]MBE3200348.1 AAA family ATPase [Parafrankia sp. CH37]CUU59776.1 transitional endoplasmic reticulum ATPase [Parafrankia irregularis]
MTRDGAGVQEAPVLDVVVAMPTRDREPGTIGMNADDRDALGLRLGDPVTLTGVARTAARVADADIPAGAAALDEALRVGAGVRTGERLTVSPVHTPVAARVILTPQWRRTGADDGAAANGAGHLLRLLGPDGRRPADRRRRNHRPADRSRDGAGREDRPAVPAPPAIIGQVVRAGTIVTATRGPHTGELRVIETVPAGVVTVGPDTDISVVDPRATTTGYDDIGGLTTEVARIREMVELPLKHPRIFERLGIDPPRGVLLYGPPGSGKTLIARAVAHQTGAVFLQVNGPEVIQKHYGESEELLRGLFAEAGRHPAAVIFFDEIDAIAPNRETVLGDVEKRVVAQLLALMDGVASRGQIVVMAATNLPNSIDPALRRPGRFDREIAINPPTTTGRLEILTIHTRHMPLAADVDLESVAATTHGFLGADLAQLCREAAMARAREALRDDRAGQCSEDAATLFVHREDFHKALAEIRLSTIRELSSDVPYTRWEDIGGLDEAKRILGEQLGWPLRYGDRFAHADARPPRGILLTGAPGTGKTLLAQAVGSTTEVNFIVAKGPELLSKWVGESERGIREVFRRARQSAPSILFFDEIDAIAPTRGAGDGNSQIGDRMVGQLLLELDDLDATSDVVVLAATNRPDLIDGALLRPGRFDTVIHLSAPDLDARLAILRAQCASTPLGHDVDLSALAAATAGRSGADLAALCGRAKMLAIADSVTRHPGLRFEPFTIDQHHFRAALAAITQQAETLETA